MNAPDRPRTDFSSVTYAEAVERAQALIPVLRTRAAQCDAEGALLPENAADIDRAGLFRIVQPKRWGGMGLDYPAVFDFPDLIGRGCMSTGWILGNLAVHHWMLALYDEQAQEEVWGPDPNAYIASGIAYPQGRGRVVDGGIELSGHWNFSSGVTPSGWNMLACVVRDGDKPSDKILDYRMCLLPVSDYEIVDDWHVMGLKGTGSRSVKCDKVFVPEHRALSMMHHRRGQDYPGWRTNPEALFRVPFGGLAAHFVFELLQRCPFFLQLAVQRAGRQIQQRGQGLCGVGWHSRVGQRLAHLLHQQAVAPVLQHGKRQRPLQHQLQSGLVAAQRQGQIPRIKTDFRLRRVELNRGREQQRIHLRMRRRFKRETCALQGDA